MKTLVKILAFLLLVSIGVIAWLWYHPKKEKEYVTVAGKSPPPQIIYSKSESGGNVATIVQPKPVLNPEKEASEELLATVRNIKELDKSQILSLLKINAELQLKLDKSNLVVNDAVKEIKVWRDKFNEVTIDNKNDTAKVKSEVSPVIAQYEKRPKWYKPKEG